MKIRDKLVLLSRKLGLWVFFLMFVYIFFARKYGLNTSYAIIFFFLSLFLFALSVLPPKISREYWAAWFFFISFILVSVGGIFMFIFHPVYGAVAFIIGIVTMIFCALISSSYREQSDTKEMEKSLFLITKELSLFLTNESTSEKLLLKAIGNQSIGKVTLILENEYPQRKKKVTIGRQAISKKLPISFSKIIISSFKKLPNLTIWCANEAIEIRNPENDLKQEGIAKLENLIREKRLNYFDFHLYSQNNNLEIIVDVAIEEKELWNDYLELAKIIIKETTR